jgi:hypothetical protein
MHLLCAGEKGNQGLFVLVLITREEVKVCSFTQLKDQRFKSRPPLLFGAKETPVLLIDNNMYDCTFSRLFDL